MKGRNMNRSIITAAILASSLSNAMANSPNSVGCGLGSQIFDGQSGIIPQSLAVITNGTFGNQTFGITSGTSGCDPDGTVVASARVPMFVGANLENLARDMASGGGESLASLATLLGVTEQDKTRFYGATKTHFGRIFARSNTTSGDVLAALYGVMNEDAALARYVPA
jgi:hypothetical protein